MSVKYIPFLSLYARQASYFWFIAELSTVRSTYLIYKNEICSYFVDPHEYFILSFLSLYVAPFTTHLLRFFLFL